MPRSHALRGEPREEVGLVEGERKGDAARHVVLLPSLPERVACVPEFIGSRLPEHLDHDVRVVLLPAAAWYLVVLIGVAARGACIALA